MTVSIFRQRFLLIAAGLAGCIATVMLWWNDTSSRASVTQGVPVVRVDETIKRLPPGPPDCVVSTTFRLYNDGAATLRIGTPELSCGCSDAVLSTREVAPGGEALLDVEVSVPHVGTQQLTVKLHTNSPVTPLVRLGVVTESDAPAPYVFEAKGGLTFRGWLEEGQVRRAFVRTWEHADSPPWVERFSSKLEYVSVGLKSIETDGPELRDHERGSYYVQRRYSLEARLAGSPPTTSARGSLEAFGAGVSEPVATIPIVVDPAKPIEITPQAIYATGEFPKEYTLVVSSAQPEFALECSVEDEESVPGWIGIRRGDTTERTQVFHLTLDKPAVEEETTHDLFRAEVTFGTNHPRQPQLVVPIYCRNALASK